MRRAWLAWWLVCSALLLLSSWRPASSTASKLISLGALSGLLTLPFVLWRRARVGLAAGSVLLVGFLLLPAREADAASLRARYLHALRGFEGTHYVWGGETHRGIDCSGLVRTALMEASFEEGLHRVDPGLLRRALALWWFDSSAQALGEGYRGWTYEVTRASSLRALDPALVHEGDLAVTQDGTHVLASLGTSTWIQADPVLMRVHLDGPESGGWFTVPVIVMRWRALD